MINSEYPHGPSPIQDVSKQPQTIDISGYTEELRESMLQRDWTAMHSILQTLLSLVDEQDSGTLEEIYTLARRETIQASEFASSKNESDKPNFQEYQTAATSLLEKTFEMKQKKVIAEAGPDVASAWDIALSDHPELRRVQVLKSDPTKHPVLEHTAGFFKNPSEWEKIPTIVIASQVPDEHFETLKTTRRRSVEIISELIGVKPTELTTRALKTFIFLHELGHADEFISYVNQQDSYADATQAWKQRYKEEMSTLPIAGMNPSKLKTALDEGHLHELLAAQNDPRIHEGITEDDLLSVQDEAYRHLPKEAYADNFAAKIIRDNRDLFI